MNQTELLDQFILEARECLEQVGQRLLDIEKAPTDPELLNDLFRLVHTLKGNCGLFEFKAMERVVHAGEDLLDRVRQGALAYNNDMADALLEAMDYTAQLVDQIERDGQIAASADGRSTQLASALRALLNAPPPAPPIAAAPSSQAAAAPATEPASPCPAWVEALPDQPWRTHPQAVIWRYQPEPECFFKGEDPWLLARQTPGLLHLHVGTQTDWPDLADADCYRCNLSFIGLSDAPLAYVEDHFRCVAEQLEVLPLSRLAPPSGAAQAPTSTAEQAAQRHIQTLRQRALQIWDDQVQLLNRGGARPGTVAAVRRALHQLLQALSDDTASQAQDSMAALPADVSAAALGHWAAAHRPADISSTEDSPPEVTDPGSPWPMPAGEALTSPGQDAARRGAGDDPAHHKVLKVGQEKIDRLMDLIGEMVVAKNALPYLAQRAETHFQQRELAREIKAQYAVINRIAEDMQHAIMQVRMMPVGTIFQRFGRLVRDISRKLGKDVQLVIEGEDTEADKNVIESLADPLIHIIRNSLDHGIEMPDVRTRAGKAAQGTIRVSARQESDRVLIEINDDGAGIDPQRIRQKAIERGLIPEDKAQTLSDTEAVQLIFLPGFSTADTISDLSGRGVGMDVVRTAVERINGSVELSSQFGKGTCLRLSLPLSMAVTNVMIIEAAGRRFGVPMDLIVETVRVHTDDIHHFKQARTTVLRGRIVPLQALHDLLALEAPPVMNEDSEYAVLVVRAGHESVGLLVDLFHGSSDIILKPLEGVLAGLTGFAGTALMGDGSVLMVLNPKELL